MGSAGVHAAIGGSRYLQALRLLEPRVEPGSAVLEVGGFLAVFPLALARLGVPVTVAERYDLYDGALDPVRTLLEEAGARVWDVDFTSDDVPAELYPVVVNMAMVEHIAGSPRQLMENLRDCCEGCLLLEVPNLAYGYKRWQLLRGRTIHPPLHDVYASATPFTGHHREYTMADLRELLELSGFRVAATTTFNYSLTGDIYTRVLAARLPLQAPAVLARGVDGSRRVRPERQSPASSSRSRIAATWASQV